MKALRFVPALVLVALAVVVALLAADVRSWQRTFASDDVRPDATWNASPRVPGDLAAQLLGIRDDVRARRAIQLFKQAVSMRARLDNALDAQGSTQLTVFGDNRAVLATASSDPAISKLRL